MKTIKALVTLVFAIGIVSFANAQNKAGKKDSTRHTVYTCPMHPDFVADKPGKCPKCGMELVEKKSPAHGRHKKDSTGMKMN
ncbi:MAG: hypothetical protein BGO55_26150 [Sphingobacteriales bacterium 50-39]|nr:hypothetical protein [Sphingobacteriales bacterium]OJW56383.1 MAG: hypothetical protein BGO55_26150 [Sphingobacteriales bacterium 50-39]